MKTYLYKFIDSNTYPTKLSPNHIINPSQEMITTYGENNGGKKLNLSSQPNNYYNVSYRETSKNIYQEWQPIDIEEAKTIAITNISNSKNQVLQSTLLVEVNGNTYDFNTEAISNLEGALIAGLTSIDWTLHDYTIVTLDQAGLAALMQAFLLKKQEIYTKQAQLVTEIKNAVSVDELANIRWEDK